MKKALATLGVVILACVGASANATLINGSFEGDFSNPLQNPVPHMNLLNGATNIPGWTVVTPGGDATVTWFTANFFGLSPRHGTKALDLTGGDAGVSGIQQMVTTNSDQEYLLSFWLGSDVRFAIPSITVNIDGIDLATFTGNPNGQQNQWEQFSLEFYTTGADTNLSLLFQGGLPGEQTCCYVGLDNVRLHAVPEPSTVALLTIGLVGLGWMGRRRQKI